MLGANAAVTRIWEKLIATLMGDSKGFKTSGGSNYGCGGNGKSTREVEVEAEEGTRLLQSHDKT